MKLVMIGTGHVAHALGRKIVQRGHQIVQVAGRNRSHASQLGMLLKATSTDRFPDIFPEADIYIIAVSDTALANAHQWLPRLHNGVVVHTAGAISRNVLSGVAEQFGVLYPLQSLRSSMEVIPDIPLLIDGDSPETLQIIRSFAVSLSARVMDADDDMRLKLHTGAVVVNNFSNYLFTLVQDFCVNENLDFSLLMPLIKETVGRLEHHPASILQTGPAIRNDELTIAVHLDILKKYPELKALYGTLTEQIIRHYHSHENR